MSSNNCLRYQGYTGTIEVSVEDNCLHGQVLMVSDLVTYEATSPAGLEKSFKDAISEYIEFCKEIGKKPDKPCSGSFNVRIGTELHREAALVSVQKDISLNEFVKQSVANELNDLDRSRHIIHEHTHTIEHFHHVSGTETSWPEIKNNSITNYPELGIHEGTKNQWITSLKENCGLLVR